MEQVNWTKVINIADVILFFYFAVCVFYLFVFALSSHKEQKGKYSKSAKNCRYAVFFPKVFSVEEIKGSIQSFLDQDYPREFFDIILIFNESDIDYPDKLSDFPVKLICTDKKLLSRGQMVKYAQDKLKPEYDAAVIMWPGNTVEPTFLSQINDAYYAGGMAIQTHKIPASLHHNISILRTFFEEMNNAIFRRGHVSLGFSASLVGTGMVFNYSWLQKSLDSIKDKFLTKSLELKLLKQGMFIEYLEQVYTIENKSYKLSDIDQERRDWYSDERKSLKRASGFFFKALFSGNFDYCDKMFQWMMPSKVFLLFLIASLGILVSLFNWVLSVKWFLLLLVQFFTFCMAMPKKMINFRTFIAFFAIPLFLISVLRNILRIRH